MIIESAASVEEYKLKHAGRVMELAHEVCAGDWDLAQCIYDAFWMIQPYPNFNDVRVKGLLNRLLSVVHIPPGDTVQLTEEVQDTLTDASEEDKHIADETSMQLYDKYERLSKREKKLFLLHFVLGLHRSEIQAEMGYKSRGIVHEMVKTLKHKLDITEDDTLNFDYPITVLFDTKPTVKGKVWRDSIFYKLQAAIAVRQNRLQKKGAANYYQYGQF